MPEMNCYHDGPTRDAGHGTQTHVRPTAVNGGPCDDTVTRGGVPSGEQRTRISVAMATCNGERFLAEQLQSIALQTRPPDEVVLSDDASSDNTVAVARDFARSAPFDVRILRTNERVGHPDNFFRAMKACTGDLIALADQDDVWHREKLTRCEMAYATTPDALLVVHSARVVDEDLAPTGPVTSWPPITAPGVIRAGRLRPFNLPYPGFALMFRSVCIRQLNADARPADFTFGYNARLRHDVWLNLVCGALGSIVLLPDQLALYRRHASAATASHPFGTAWQGFRRTIRGSLTLSSESVAYRIRSETGLEYATYLDQLRPLARELGESAVVGLERTARAYRRYADVMEHRAEAYQHGVKRMRALHVARNVLRGDYGSPSTGRLGVASLARDMTIGLRTGSGGRAVPPRGSQ